MAKIAAILDRWWRAEAPAPIVDKEIVSAAAQSDVTVFIGTLFEDLVLPEQVEVTLDDASTQMLNVTWAQGSYNGSALGTYSLVGTFDFYPGIANTANVTASIDVIVEAREITGAPAFDDVGVANGTSFGSIDLPDSGIFTIEGGQTVELAITWAAGSYNGSVAGTYTVLGTPTLITGVTNPGTAIKAEIDIIVASADAPSFTASTFAITGDVLGGSVTYTGTDDESNIPPQITSVEFAGVLQEGEDGEITIEVENNTGYAIAGATIQIYRANTQQGGSEALSGTVDSGDISIVGNTVTGTYTFGPSDVGKYVRAHCVVTLADGVNDDSEAASSLWTDDTIEAAVVVGGITYFGSTSNPADNGTLNTSPVAVTPPASMAAGDLVLLIAQTRTSGATLAISNAGGQTWNALTSQNNGVNNGTRMFWARFNGTWSANPSVSMSGSALATTVVMHVFRPTNPANTWAIDVAMNSLQDVAPVSNKVNIAGITTVAASTVSVAVWASPDDNTWGNKVGAWDVLGNAQYRNVAGSDISLVMAYKVQTSAGVTGDVSMEQLTVVGDLCITQIVAFKEVV